jgi:tetratricopeptide (TPR) repeat protein
MDLVQAAALANLEAGRFDEVEALCRPILAKRPNDIVALQCLGAASLRAGKPDEAVAYLRRASKARRGDVGLLTNLGVALKVAGRIEEAVKTYGLALKAAPHAGETWFNLGNALKDLGRLGEAEQAFRKAIAAGNCSAGGANVYCNLGLLWEDCGAFDAAIAAYQQTLKLRPNHPELYYNLGNALRGKLALDEAIGAYDTALRLRPEYPQARLNQSLAFLQKGDFARGFAGYEARLDTDEVERRGFSAPQWTGEPLMSRTLLLHAEQGLGDTIQFLRYLPTLNRLGSRIVLEVHPALRRLVDRKIEHDALGCVAAVSRGDELPPFDVQLHIMSLPYVLGFDLANIPGTSPYMWPDPVALQDWTARLHDRSSIRIGLVWAGNRKHRNDRNRSMAPATLLPLLEGPWSDGRERRFFSLQVGASAADLATFPPGAVTDLAPFLNDFDDTAAAICALDLVVCVDTSVAHLAAALGKRVELLLPYNPDWRWLLDRAESPWYPTVRIHRQTSVGDWSGVMATLASELQSRSSLENPSSNTTSS